MLTAQEQSKIWVYFKRSTYQARVAVGDASLPALLESLRLLAPIELRPSLSFPPNEYKLFTFPEPIRRSARREETIKECHSTDRTEVGGNIALDEFGYDYSPSYVYFAIQSPDDHLLDVMHDFEKTFPDLSECLRVNVERFNTWGPGDVTSNGGVEVALDTDHHVHKDLDTIFRFLKRKRWYKLGNCEERELAQRFEDTFHECYVGPYPIEFDPEEHFPAAGPSEFRAFYYLGSHFPEYVQSYTTGSSSMKAGSFTAYFTHTPCLSARKARENLHYRENTSWGFPLLVTQDSGHLPSSLWEYGGPIRKFIPRSDFDLIHQVLFAQCPLIVGEVVSDEKETDRWRLPVAAIVAARVGSYLTKANPELPFFVTAIYITKAFQAERYLLLPKGQTINIQERREAQLFLREIFNLTSIAALLADQFDGSKLESLTNVKKLLKSLPALTTTKGGTRQSAKRDQHGTAGAAPPNKAEESMQTDDNTSVFQRPEIRAAVQEFGKKFKLIHTERPDIAWIINLENLTLLGYLKFIPAGGDEFEILSYLAAMDDEKNHTIRPIRWWPTNGGTILYTLNAGGPLTQLEDPGMHLQSIAWQLFEAVAFMHRKGVAHLDLKPDNIIIPSEGGRLAIIDFSVSVRVSGINDAFGGKVGTEGYMAPEVGTKPCSAIRADLWSCGKIMQEFCSKCPESRFRDWLLDVSQQLMHKVPDERPTMDQVFNWLSDYSVVELNVTDTKGTMKVNTVLVNG